MQISGAGFGALFVLQALEFLPAQAQKFGIKRG
jgi:hypothetical protein